MLPDLVDEATDGQVVQDAVRRRGVQAGLLADLFQRDRIGVGSQHVEQAERALQHLYRRCLVFALCHARDCHRSRSSFVWRKLEA